MSQILIDKIRRGRQTRVEHNGKTFIVRRPTFWEAGQIAESGKNLQLDILEKFVLDWEGFTELDLVPGGDASPVQFSKELFVEWAQDNPEFWNPITAAIRAEYEKYQSGLESAEKK